MSESDFPLPPATFEFLVFSLKMQAELRLGIVDMPGEAQPATDLRTARHTIDMLAMIHEKTRGNLSTEEQRLIENSLTELRFRFVQVSEDTAKSSAAATVQPDAAKLPNEPKAGQGTVPPEPELPNEPTDAKVPKESEESREPSEPKASQDPFGDSGKMAE